MKIVEGLILFSLSEEVYGEEIDLLFLSFRHFFFSFKVLQIYFTYYQIIFYFPQKKKISYL